MEDVAANQFIATANNRRLRLLQIQAARQGANTPPEILNEILDLGGDIPLAAGSSGVAMRDLASEMTMLANNFNRFMVVSMVGMSSGVLLAAADFILIIALRGR